MADTSAASPPVTVDRLRSDETDAGASLLARSFVDERIFAHIFEGCERDRVERATTRWFRAWIRSCLPLGEVHAARLDGKLVGVGVRIPPGGFPLHRAAQIRFMRGLMGGMLRMAMTSRRALRLGSFARQLARLEPDEPFWNLVWIGVDPDLQRHGIGSALADEVIGLADSSSTACWLVTFGPHTRTLYERRGFAVETEVRPFPDGPTGWTLRRGPQEP
jgi:GNAT superfamily N-acetyltransferase